MIVHCFLILAPIHCTTFCDIKMEWGDKENRIAVIALHKVVTTFNGNQAGMTSIFSPRMDFDQWKPLTGRGDPLRNDPTYDYDPPVLDRVHYWADDTAAERDRHPDRKSEVLMLGVSSRKPSITPRPSPLPPSVSSRQPLPPPRRQHTRLPPLKYEDFTYKLSDQYPLTILVPPPPPPPGQQPLLFILPKDKSVSPNPPLKLNNLSNLIQKNSTTAPQTYSTSFALEEANLIYQSSTTSHNWVTGLNETNTTLNNDIISDYAGWGPTTPIDEYEAANDTHNFISNDHGEFSHQPYSFLKPILTQSFSPFVPTPLPDTMLTKAITHSTTKETTSTELTTLVTTTDKPTDYKETTSLEEIIFVTQPAESPTTMTSESELGTTLLDMLGPMMSMPLVNGPERLEDNLYAHASQHKHVFQAPKYEELVQLETMQTMQPPPPTRYIESTTTSQSVYIHTHDPYLHMRFTTPTTTTESAQTSPEKINPAAESPSVPMYLIIQGHSKVKTYGSKSAKSEEKNTESNEISKGMETNEVRHLHPLKEKAIHKSEEVSSKRASKAHNLKTLVDNGLGSIEIQETDIGIKYDVSDGSDVPLELYKKGAVYSDNNDYNASSKTKKLKRTKRQLDLEDFLPFDEDTLEEYVYNFLEGKKNDSSITGLIAQAITSEDTAVLDELEDEER
ncbi:hypothetical protein K1T71_008733 [Dendrolimus kikuchii]|uniref:Uncharacterized protein n=1 Tax=Dendrolimus kikuchii TaxID=765133 RepID=A0ACC1CV55_9NEOP|nr:hypothetical protein K1T71_008733 [Dendrolimus kikuchii]